MISRKLLITIAVLLVVLLCMGLYGLHLRQQALLLKASAVSARPIAPPISGPKQPIIIYLPDDQHGSLFRRQTTVSLPPEPTLRAREIVRLLITSWQDKDSLHPIGADADVKEVFLLDNNHIAIVDVNAAFAEQHRSGILVEELTLASIARTLGENVPGIEQVKVIVEGHERETLAGHANLNEFYSTKLDWRTD